MILDNKEPLTSSKFIDYQVEEFDPLVGRSFGPEYSFGPGFYAFSYVRFLKKVM